MRHEQILLCGRDAKERRCRADKIVLPDIRFQGLFVSREEQKVFNCAYRYALRVRELIVVREKNRCHKEKFEIDIPNLWLIATRQEDNVSVLRKELRDEIATFMVLFKSLVQHFLIRPKCLGYSYDGKTKHGVKYKGYAWVSD
jgi:hypothetical protein